MGSSAATLGLPLASPRAAQSCAVAVGAVYAFTCAPDLSFYDSPELALAATHPMGLGHPPGQPLHTLLAGLLTWLPLPAPLCVTLVSVLAGAATVLPAFCLAEQTLGEGDDPRRPWWIAAALFLAALHPCLWEQSTRTEVYALAAFFGTWAAARLASALPRPTARQVFSAGLALGFAASVNAMLATFVAVATLPAWLGGLRRRDLGLRATAAAVGGGLLGLAPYAYVVWAGEHAEGFVWGAPRVGGSLAHFLTAADYATNYRIGGDLWLAHFLDWFAYAASSGWLPLVLLGLAAPVALRLGGLGRAFAPVLFVASLGFLSRQVVWHPEVPDYVSYISLASWCAAGGCAALAAHLARRTSPLAGAAVLAALLGLLLVAPPVLGNRTRRHDRSARAMAMEVLEGLPHGALLLAQSDHLVAPMLYLQRAEGARPDVTLVIRGLASSSWYWEDLRRHAPNLRDFPLQGEGGPRGRLLRLLGANRHRPLRLEHAELAAALGIGVCAEGLVVRPRAAGEATCPLERAPDPAVLARLAEIVGDGEPTSRQAIAAVSLTAGEQMWREGRLDLALALMLAPHPEVAVHPSGAYRAAPAPVPPAPHWRGDAAILDPRRTLFRAAQVAYRAGDAETAHDLLARAADDGLAEAEELLVQGLDLSLR